MVRKVVIALLSLVSVAFLVLTCQRVMMEYNENGVYFDGEVTYDRDAVVAYGTLTGVLLLLTVATRYFWKGTPES